MGEKIVMRNVRLTKNGGTLTVPLPIAIVRHFDFYYQQKFKVTLEPLEEKQS